MSNTEFNHAIWAASAINTLSVIVGIVINDRKMRQVLDSLRRMNEGFERGVGDPTADKSPT